VERNIRPEIGHLKVAAVTRQDIYKLHAARSAAPRQANIMLSVCSKIFNLAELWEMRPEGTNPCTKIDRYHENHRERFLSAEELARLGATLRQAENPGLPRKNGARTVYRRVTTATVELLLFTGCRLSEVLNLKWDQIDFFESKIKLLMTKSGRPQDVTLNPQARQVLQQLQGVKKSEWVLPSISCTKRPLSKAGIEAAWMKLRKAAQLDDVRLHDLRHTVGTYAAQAGANAFLVRDLLRHKNLAMTGRYVNRADNPLRNLSAQVGERISAALAGR
jgi:integrase